MKTKIILFLFSLSLLASACQSQPARKTSTPEPEADKKPINMIKLTSTAFSQGQPIPKKYSCEGQSVNPPFDISGVPANAKSLAFLMDDPDVPKNLKPDGVFDHWVIFNMPPSTIKIDEASTPPGTQGNNGAGKPMYTGPCPPDREHRYFFRLYALDTMLDLKSGATKNEVLNAIQGHIIEQTELMGTYNKEKK